MKLIRLILFPIVPIYYLVTWLRNWLYDVGLKSSKSYNFPVIAVGNLSTGGTGKTPMVAYLIELLYKKTQIATLSRGYKRQTKGFVLANAKATAKTIGDEPFQLYSKFKNAILVAVDANRQEGITLLRKHHPQPKVIILDDAYQHRKVKAGFYILLTAYSNLYIKDIVLPTGNLREPKLGAKRADVIVVTKCPKTLSDADKQHILKTLKLQPKQRLFFSHINYSENIKGITTKKPLTSINNFTLVTGIANASPLVDYLKSKSLQFEHLEYKDHYNFKPSDIELFSKKNLILTTEKDFMRLSANPSLHKKLFYLPITCTVSNAVEFNKLIFNFTELE